MRVLVLLLPALCLTHPQYMLAIPNANLVRDPLGFLTPGVGHVMGITGGGVNNPFGLDFRAQGHVWTWALCQMDSDGDGLSNGFELGDPRCTWRPGSGGGPANPLSAVITNPGIPNNLTTVQLAMLRLQYAMAAKLSPGTLSNSSWIPAHVGVMLTAVGVLLPVGASMPFYHGAKMHVWQPIHISLMALANALIFLGLFIAALQTTTWSTHGSLGVITACLVVGQVVVAFWRRSFNSLGLWKVAHKYNGRLLVLMAAVMVQTGYGNLQVASPVFQVWSWVHALSIAGSGVYLWVCVKRKAGSSTNNEFEAMDAVGEVAEEDGTEMQLREQHRVVGEDDDHEDGQAY
jgi:hypothetical protein